MSFETINKALGDYYTKQGDNTFFSDPDGVGKFLNYCNENGLDEADLVDEFAPNTNASDCMYCDFDDDFPIDKSIKITTDADRVREIFRILKYIIIHGVAPRFFAAMDFDINISKKDLKKAENIYNRQCPVIFSNGEDVLKECFAINIKNNFPFLSYLVDSYHRDKFVSKKKIDLTVSDWMKLSPYIKILSKKKNKKKLKVIEHGIGSFMKRVCPGMPNNGVFTKIKDDCESIMKYFISSAQFVNNLIDQQKAMPPFMIDVLIAVRDSIKPQNALKPDFSDNDSDYSSDDDDDDDDDDDKNDDDDDDMLGNISDKLNDNQLPSVSKAITANRGYDRFMQDTYKDFKNILGGDQNNNNMSSYPHKKRFISLVDRRGKKLNKNSNDMITMFSPPNNCNSLPSGNNDAVPEWYFNAAKTCLIPPKGYNNGNNVNVSNRLIRADTAANGSIITLSFHVEAATTLRLYLFWSGQFMRIAYIEELQILFKIMFDLNYGKNSQYLNSGKLKLDFAKMKIKDDAFDAFYKKVTIDPAYK